MGFGVGDVWRAAQRRGAVAYINLSETLLRTAGRRKPYGILKIELTGELAEQQPEQRLFGMLRRSTDDYLTLVTLLRWARDDHRLTGMLITSDGISASWARL